MWDFPGGVTPRSVTRAASATNFLAKQEKQKQERVEQVDEYLNMKVVLQGWVKVQKTLGVKRRFAILTDRGYFYLNNRCTLRMHVCTR